MLRGDPGSVRSRALRTTVEYGKAFDAKRLVPVQSCHLAGSFGIVRFKAYYSILELMVDEGLRVVVPTTVNPRPGARLNLINRFVFKNRTGSSRAFPRSA